VISAGRLKYVATVLQPSGSKDALGLRDSQFAGNRDMRVELSQISSSEQLYADGASDVATWRVRCRWPDIARCQCTTASRLAVRGKILRITGIVNTYEMDRVAVIDCVEVT
jgi:head-tail adaptor